MTRDRIYAPGEWCGKTFEVIDTGGILPDEKNMMASEIYNQARVAMEESSQLVLVVDGRKGAMPLDEELAGLLRREGKPLSLAVNKIDENSTAPLAADFYRLGIPHLFAISAEHGSGVDDLLDHVTRNFPRDQEGVEVRDEVIQIAIIGHPNVGKSTLLNRLTGRERSIVTPVAGTTRDAVDAEIERDGHRFRLVDTAGIRRKGKTRLMAEKLSVIQARKHLERSDVALLLLDAAEGVTALDTHIGGYAHESGRSVILVVNKWDAVKKDTRSTLEFTRTVREQMKYLNYAPVVFISALTGQRTSKLFASVAEVAAARRQRISTAELNRFVETLDLERAASPAGKPLRLYYLTQAGTSPPIFVAFTNRPLYFSVGRYIENRLREKFGFNGTPVIIKSRLKK